MVKLINRTGHKINLNNGSVIDEDVDETGAVVMTTVKSSYTDFDSDLICEQTFGDIQNLPEEKPDTIYIVSAITLAAAKKIGRNDFVAPATGHPACIRNPERTKILSVPGFVR